MKDIFNSFSQSAISISYLGKTDDEITAQLIQLADSYLQNSDGLQKLSRRVPFLIAESFQNVIRHGNQNNNGSAQEIEKDCFQIFFKKDRVNIFAVNQIKTKYVELLDEKINSINTLNQEELKELWRSTLTDGKVSTKGGAGLGIIEMARKSQMPIKKKFVPIDAENSIFFMGIEILKKGASTQSHFDISEAESHYTSFLKEGVILEYNGHFTEATNAPLIEILESNLIDGNEIDSTSAGNLSMIIEVMQNTSKHAKEIKGMKEGIFSIYKLNNELIIGCGNFMNSQNHSKLKNRLEKIKLLNLKEIKAERNKQMFEESLEEDGNGGLGLLEVALFTENKFEYSFLKMSDDHYFYSIEIKLKNNG